MAWTAHWAGTEMLDFSLFSFFTNFWMKRNFGTERMKIWGCVSHAIGRIQCRSKFRSLLVIGGTGRKEKKKKKKDRTVEQWQLQIEESSCSAAVTVVPACSFGTGRKLSLALHSSGAAGNVTVQWLVFLTPARSCLGKITQFEAPLPSS